MDQIHYKSPNHSMDVWGIAVFFVALLAVVSLFSWL